MASGVTNNYRIEPLKVFGSKAFFMNKDTNKSKFDSRAKPGIFAGYSEQYKAYRIWDPSNKKIIVTRDVKILDKFDDSRNRQTMDPFLKLKDSTSNNPINVVCQKQNQLNAVEPTTPDEESSTDDEYDHQEDHNVRDGNHQMVLRDRSQLQAPSWISDYEVDISALCMNEALQGTDSADWNAAIINEIKAHLKNNTWQITNKKVGSNVIGSKIVLKNKFNAEGKLERRKARLVARGFTQQPGVDFTETYAPVAKLSSIRMLLALAMEEDLHIEQLDVSTAFPNGELEEEIFMQKPENLEKFLLQIMVEESDSDQLIYQNAKNMLEELRKPGEKVCLLQKALYGLKQAGRQWYQKLDSNLKELGFEASSADPCIYKCFKGGDKILLAIYVDGLILASKNQTKLNYIKKDLMNLFEMKNLGTLQHCLGIQFSKKDGALYAYQTNYIDELLHRFNMESCNPVRTPMSPGLQLKKNTDDPDKNDPYQNLIGALMYLSVATRPDINHSVSFLSQFNFCYDKSHWLAAKRVLRYLKGTRDLALVFRKTGEALTGYADANWGSCSDDRRSYTGYCFKYANAMISWESRKQRTVALSTQEAEYMALTDSAKEAIHLKQLIADMGTSLKSIVIYNDNTSALNLSKNPLVTSRSKHINIREHFIREKVQSGDIILRYKPTEEMEADLFTKGLAGPRHDGLTKAVGLFHVG